MSCPDPAFPLPCATAPRGHSPSAFSNFVLPAPWEATVPVPGKGLPVCLPACLCFCLFSYTVLLLCCYVSQELTTLVTNQNVRPAQQGGRVLPLPMWSVPRKRTVWHALIVPRASPALQALQVACLAGSFSTGLYTGRVLSVPGWIESNPIPKSCASLCIAWE